MKVFSRRSVRQLSLLSEEKLPLLQYRGAEHTHLYTFPLETLFEQLAKRQISLI